MWRGRVLCFIILFGSPLTSIAAEEGAPAVAGAQPDSELAEIIGTAQKRSERVTDVPLSITAVSSDELARQGVTSASDLERVVPGFTFQPSSRDEPVYAIRVKETTKAYPAGPWTDLPYLQDRGEHRRRLLAERAARLSAMIPSDLHFAPSSSMGKACGLFGRTSVDSTSIQAIIRCRARMSRISCCCLIRRRDASFGAALPRYRILTSCSSKPARRCGRVESSYSRLRSRARDLSGLSRRSCSS